MTGRVVSKNGMLTGLTDVVLAPLINTDGRPLIHSRRWYDSEALALADGIAYISFERVQQIMRFDFGASGIHARGEPVEVPPEMRALPGNKGVEALVVAPPDSDMCRRADRVFRNQRVGRPSCGLHHRRAAAGPVQAEAQQQL